MDKTHQQITTMRIQKNIPGSYQDKDSQQVMKILSTNTKKNRKSPAIAIQNYRTLQGKTGKQERYFKYMDMIIP